MTKICLPEHCCVCFIDNHHCVYTSKMCMCVSPPALCIFAICVLLAGILFCLSGRLGPCVCQDAPSFGNSLLSSIFSQVTHLSSVCVCVYMCVCGCLDLRVRQDAPFFGNSLSRFSIFCQVTLLSSVCVCVCICVCVGVWVLVYVRMFHPSATACQDVPSFVR